MPTSIKVELKNTNVKLTKKTLEALKKKISKLEPPAFFSHNPDFKEIERVCAPYQKFKNIIVIANGGSRTSGLAYLGALGSGKKIVEFCSTMDPVYIEMLKKRFKPKDTLVMPISKSGTNVDVLEPLSAFWDRYTVLAVTGNENSLLKDLADAKGWGTLVHPEVGGRYSGRTTSAYGVAHLAGIDFKKIDAGAKAAYKEYAFDAPVSKNGALNAAVAAYELEQKGYTEIFAPIYSWEYHWFLPLMVQLIHESTGKDGKGQTIFGDLGPESQHHTNQRFFGGRKNVMGMFVVNEETFKRRDSLVKIPSVLSGLKLNEGVLGDLNNVPMGRALQFDFEGVADNAAKLGVPYVVVRIKDASAHSVGYFLSFLHYFTVYSALLRNQNPYDQPEVEGAKMMSFEKRKNFKG
ncbi:MAG: hypothetical protein O2877_02335 [bacterium]|nr:hypothetical protein [bacterium]